MESQIEFYKKQCLVPYVTIITTMVFCDELEKLKDFALVYSLKSNRASSKNSSHTIFSTTSWLWLVL